MKGNLSTQGNPKNTERTYKVNMHANIQQRHMANGDSGVACSELACKCQLNSS